MFGRDEKVSQGRLTAVQYIILGIACAAALATNADAVMIANRLWTTPALRAQAVAGANAYQPGAKADTASIQGLIGWSGPFSPRDPRYDPRPHWERLSGSTS